MTGTHRGSVEDRVPQARIYKVWNIPEYGQADDDYLDLVSDCLARGKNSRLYKRLVYDDQIATDVSATVNPERDRRAVRNSRDRAAGRGFVQSGEGHGRRGGAISAERTNRTRDWSA